ncbi:unnamed protein product [Bursaphelenchus xylophilus]|uniref:(pine wood nematode) hypothetical protein n=1 Tax=Bursaphelenchus xylophilus TaxID=6326 RepID=A0A1I7RXQ0_BURXY|nr:unnamed protein product [Bursaphelenchus xylophilus]CAG9126643.1 unnamed protein product [Bursaphelenchus xylophilus]
MGIFLNESDLPSAEFLQFYTVFEDIALGVTVIMVPFTILVMVFTSNSVINNYRLLLINELSWSLLFDIMASLIGAVVLFPLPCYYGVNVTSALSHTQQLIYFVFGVGFNAMKDISIFYQLEYILLGSLAIDSKARAFLEMKSKKCSVIIFIVGLLGAIFGPVIYFLPDQEEQKQLLISLDPSIGKLYEDHPDIICFTAGTSPKKAIMVAFAAVVSIPFLMLFYLIIMYSSMHRSNWSPNTHRLQMMIFRSLVFQLIAFTVLMWVPSMVLISLPLFEICYGPIVSVICFCFFLMHTPFDCFMILYFIKPYRNVVANLLKVLSGAMSLQSEEVKNLTNYYYKWLAETDNPSEFRTLLLCIELALDIASVPVNMIIAWCLMKTQTFHFNVRLLMLNDVLCGITEMSFRVIIVANILAYDTLVPLNVKKLLQFCRGVCVYQVQFGFLSILIERLIAVNLPHRYEKTPIYVGIAMVVIWWLIVAVLVRSMSAGYAILLEVSVHLLALFLTQHWISSQRAYSRPTATLSTRYQVVENIKTLSMFRYWVYFYVFMGIIQKVLILFCVRAFEVGDKELWRVFSSFFELAHATYFVFYPAFLLYGSHQLRRRLYSMFRIRNRSTIAAESHVAGHTEGMGDADAFNTHFKRLEESWERPLK